MEGITQSRSTTLSKRVNQHALVNFMRVMLDDEEEERRKTRISVLGYQVIHVSCLLFFLLADDVSCRLHALAEPYVHILADKS